MIINKLNNIIKEMGTSIAFALLDGSHLSKIAYVKSNLNILIIKEWSNLFKSTNLNFQIYNTVLFTIPTNTIKSAL